MSSVLLLLYHFLAFSFVSIASSSSVHLASASSVAAGATNTEFIRTLCNITQYPDLCLKSLSRYATFIGVDTELLAYTALNVTLQASRSTVAAMKKMARLNNLTPMEIQAMHDCVEQLSDSVDELWNSLRELKQLSDRRRQDFDMVMSDIETWVSAALTDGDTCTDGFAGNPTSGSGVNFKPIVRRRIVNVAHLTSNALALINHFAEQGG